MSPTYSPIILGAGLAGISSANFFSESAIEYSIYERNSYLGGHAASHDNDGWIFDEGPHISFTKVPNIKELLARSIDYKFFDSKARILNLWEGLWLQHPVQANLFGLPEDLISQCISDFERVQSAKNCSISSYADWCLHYLGESISNNFVFKYTKKYWTVDADQMTIDWLCERIYRPSIQEVRDGASSKREDLLHYLTEYRYPKVGGFGSYCNGLAKGLDINYCHEVTEIDPINKRIFFSNGVSQNYSCLVSTIPLPELIKRINGVPEDVVTAAEELLCTSVFLVNVGINRNTGFPDADWFYSYDDDLIFSRVCFPHKFSANNVPEGCGSIQAEVYYSRFKPLNTDDVLSNCLESLRSAGIIQDADKILFTELRNIKYANVVFNLERQKALNKIKNYLEPLDIFLAGRYGLWEYLWSDDSILSGFSAAKNVINYLKK